LFSSFIALTRKYQTMALHKKSKTSGDIEFFSAVLCVSL
jgi:hypothetical protein